MKEKCEVVVEKKEWKQPSILGWAVVQGGNVSKVTYFLDIKVGKENTEPRQMADQAEGCHVQIKEEAEEETTEEVSKVGIDPIDVPKGVLSEVGEDASNPLVQVELGSSLQMHEAPGDALKGLGGIGSAGDGEDAAEDTTELPKNDDECGLKKIGMEWNDGDSSPRKDAEVARNEWKKLGMVWTGRGRQKRKYVRKFAGGGAKSITENNPKGTIKNFFSNLDCSRNDSKLHESSLLPCGGGKRKY